MIKYATLLLTLCASLPAFATDNEDLRVLREQILQLEKRVLQAEVGARPPSSESAFNPALSLILAGTYGQFKQDPAIPATGFAMAAHTPPEQGFNLGESELGIMANIDPDFRGTATMSLSPAGGVSVENALVESLGLGHGLNFKFGRYFSGLGYLNEQHAHAWDFVDQPLVYRSLWNNQLGEDGVQFKWLVPTDTFMEIGAEMAKGRGFPGTDTPKNGSNAGVLFAHIGDDIGTDHSWRVGMSLHQTHRLDAVSAHVPDLIGTVDGVSNSFTGDSKTTGVDFIWKYAPNGNIKETNLKVQGEYFRRTETGLLTYNTAAANITDSYAATQSGWYAQSVVQLMPRWRAGLRYDRLDPGIAQVGTLNTSNVIGDYGYTPKRITLMVDFSPSEFSRLRVQVAQDESRQGLKDDQLFVQYLMSLGAHGAHKF
jgi:hypothetical protein